MADSSLTFNELIYSLPCLALNGAQNSRALIAHQGAQVLSWHGSDGKERLYLSSQTGGLQDVFTDIGHTPAIRGGIPISFPQFSDRGNLIKHGFARNLWWDVAAVAASNADINGNFAVFTLRDNAETQTMWPHAFEAQLAVTVDAGQLTVSLKVTNTSEAPWQFTTALHTYLKVDDIRCTQLLGLQNVRYQDATANNIEVVQQESELSISAEIDRVYLTPPARLQLLENGVPSLTIEQQGFGDTVVWNPGPIRAQALPDFPDDDWLHMLCVEAACAAKPVTVQPGQTWSGAQILTIAK
jgi:glucose-6-phosphate 1-epimerase